MLLAINPLGKIERFLANEIVQVNCAHPLENAFQDREVKLLPYVEDAQCSDCFIQDTEAQFTLLQPIADPKTRVIFEFITVKAFRVLKTV